MEAESEIVRKYQSDGTNCRDGKENGMETFVVTLEQPVKISVIPVIIGVQRNELLKTFFLYLVNCHIFRVKLSD